MYIETTSTRYDLHDMQASSSKDDMTTVPDAQARPSLAPEVSMESPDHSVPRAKATSTKKRRDRKSKVKKGLGLETQPSKARIRKLVPPRPFPTVPTSSSATGPRSAHAEGKNRICITRKTKLGMYLRRCKEVILKDGCVYFEFLQNLPDTLLNFQI